MASLYLRKSCCQDRGRPRGTVWRQQGSTEIVWFFQRSFTDCWESDSDRRMQEIHLKFIPGFTKADSGQGPKIWSEAMRGTGYQQNQGDETKPEAGLSDLHTRIAMNISTLWYFLLCFLLLSGHEATCSGATVVWSVSCTNWQPVCGNKCHNFILFQPLIFPLMDLASLICTLRECHVRYCWLTMGSFPTVKEQQ